jgi:hypothetical protein
MIFHKCPDLLKIGLNLSGLSLKHPYFWRIEGHEGLLYRIKDQISRLAVVVVKFGYDFGGSKNQILLVKRLGDNGSFRLDIFLELGFDLKT